MLQSLNPDIISLNETHLVTDEVAELSGYSWFGNNRKRHIHAPKGSGGVGLLVRTGLFQHFKISVVDKGRLNQTSKRLNQYPRCGYCL